MTHKPINQKGIAALEALLILVIGAIIGGTGYYIYHANNKATDSQNAAQTDANSAVSHKTTAKTSPTAQYTTIAEWGVKAPYVGSLKLQYALSDDGKAANFTSDQLLAADAACTTDFGGSISRYAPEDTASDSGADVSAKERAAKTAKSDYAYVGGYYYFFTHSQAACGTDAGKTKALQQQTNNAVQALVPKLQAVPAAD